VWVMFIGNSECVESVCGSCLLVTVCAWTVCGSCLLVTAARGLANFRSDLMQLQQVGCKGGGGAVQEQRLILFIYVNQEERLVNTRRAYQQVRQQSGDVHGAAVGSRVRYCCCERARATWG